MKSLVLVPVAAVLLAAAYHFRHAVHDAVELCGLGVIVLAVIVAGCGIIPLLPYGRPRPETRSRLGARPPSAAGRLDREQPQPASPGEPAGPEYGSRPPWETAGTCGSCLGRPAETDRAGWPLCGQCAEKIDAVAAHAHEVAGAEIARLAVARARALAEEEEFKEFARHHSLTGE